jgi:hypothetical protein
MNRAWLLMAEFEEADIPLAKVAPKYLGMDERTWKRAASLQQLPFPVFRAGNQKSPWLVSVNELARFLDAREANAKRDWKGAA